MVRRAPAVHCLIAVTGLVVGCGRVDFQLVGDGSMDAGSTDASTSDAGMDGAPGDARPPLDSTMDTRPPLDAPLLDAPPLDAPPPDAPLLDSGTVVARVLGSAICRDTSSTITVAGSGVSVGATLVVTVGFRDRTVAPVAVSDSAGNTYSVELPVTDIRPRTTLLWTRVANPLPVGGTITVTHPGGSAALAVQVDELMGVGALDGSNRGNSSGARPRVTLGISVPNALIIGAVANRNRVPFTVDAPWTALGDLETSCAGIPQGNANLRTYWRIAPSGTVALAGSLASSDFWVATEIAFAIP